MPVNSGRNNEPTRLTETHGFIYVIKSRRADMYKIGLTRNHVRRFRELEVGKKADKVEILFTRDPEQVEKRIHDYWDAFRLPQSEWFALDRKHLEELLEDIQRISHSIEMDWEKKHKSAQTKAKRRDYSSDFSINYPNKSIPQRGSATSIYGDNKSKQRRDQLNLWSWEELKYPLGGLAFTFIVLFLFAVAGK